MAPRTGAWSAVGKASSGSKWSDQEKLVYLFILLEHSGTKIQWATAPIPTGRTRIACERMYGGLRVKLQDDINEMLEKATPAKAAKAIQQTKSTSKSATPTLPEDDEEPEQAIVTKGRKRRAESTTGGASKPKKAKGMKVKVEDAVDEDVAA